MEPRRTRGDGEEEEWEIMVVNLSFLKRLCCRQSGGLGLPHQSMTEKPEAVQGCSSDLPRCENGPLGSLILQHKLILRSQLSRDSKLRLELNSPNSS